MIIKKFKEFLLESESPILGRSILADFPDFDLNDVDVKTDTGAYTSSIHCTSIEKLDDDSIKFTPINGKEVVLPLEHEKDIRSSNGEVENRPVVKSKIIINGETYDIYLTLTDRSDMTYPVLLGSRFLANKFLINPVLEKKSLKNYQEFIIEENEQPYLKVLTYSGVEEIYDYDEIEDIINHIDDYWEADNLPKWLYASKLIDSKEDFITMFKSIMSTGKSANINLDSSLPSHLHSIKIIENSNLTNSIKSASKFGIDTGIGNWVFAEKYGNEYQIEAFTNKFDAMKFMNIEDENEFEKLLVEDGYYSKDTKFSTQVVAKVGPKSFFVVDEYDTFDLNNNENLIKDLYYARTGKVYNFFTTLEEAKDYADDGTLHQKEETEVNKLEFNF